MRITESQLRQIIRQEVSRAVLSESFKFPSSYPKSWRADRAGYDIGDAETGYDDEAELAVSAGIPMNGSPEHDRIMAKGGREMDNYYRKRDKARAAYAAANPPPPLAPMEPDALSRPKGALKFPPGVKREDKDTIKHVLDIYYREGDPEYAAEELRYYTLVFEDGYEPEGDPHEDVFHSIEPESYARSEQVLNVIRVVDKAAAAAIAKALPTVEV